MVKSFLLLSFIFISAPDLSYTSDLDRPPEVDKVAYSPATGDVVDTNPSAFVWLPVDGVSSYILQYSTSPEFIPEPASQPARP